LYFLGGNFYNQASAIAYFGYVKPHTITYQHIAVQHVTLCFTSLRYSHIGKAGYPDLKAVLLVCSKVDILH